MRNDFELNPFSVYFNILKMKYVDLDERLTTTNFICVGDKVNVFINLETIFKQLSMVKDLEQKIFLTNEFIEIIESDLLNICAHYRRFFANNGCETKVFVYYTDFKSDKYSQCNYIPEYRSYYKIKYNENPKFTKLISAWEEKIYPEAAEIFSLVEGVYIVKVHNVEGGLLPYILSKEFPDAKNMIVGSELYETQYSAIDNFMNFCAVKSRGNPIKWLTSIEDYIQKFFPKHDDIEDIISVFKNYDAYVFLLAIMRDKDRSIEGIPGLGPVSFYKMLKSKFTDLSIMDAENIPLSLCDTELSASLKNNYNALSVINGYTSVTKSDIALIKNQLTDKFDNNKLISLNRKKFFDHQLILEALTCGVARTFG